MKKLITSFLISFVIVSFSSSNLFAAEDSNEKKEAIKIGVAASVQGTVRVTGKNRGIVKSGMELFLNDRVITGNNGSLQVLLLDETVFTLGPNSDMVLDEFVYDPGTSSGKVSAKIVKGVFRFITGKIATKNPSNMNVKIQAGNIGIRGTIVAGRTGPDGSTVILTGPGSKNNAGERPGAIYVSGITSPNDNNLDGVNGYFLNTPGEGTNVSSEGIVEKPRMMQNELSELNQVLDYSGDGKKEEEENTEIYEDPDNQGEKKDEKGEKDEGESKENSEDSSSDSSSSDNDADGSSKNEEGNDDSNLGDMSEQAGEQDSDAQADAESQSSQSAGNAENTQSSNETKQEELINKKKEEVLTILTQTEINNLINQDNAPTRARYEIPANSTITGTKKDGTSITRGITFSTVFNFLDTYLQDTYLAITSEGDDKENKYYEYNGKYIPGSYNDDTRQFQFAGTGGTYAITDPDLDSSEDSYSGFTADLSFSKGGSFLNAIAGITVNTSSGSLTLDGNYSIAGNSYTGNITGRELSRFVNATFGNPTGITSAMYHVNGTVPYSGDSTITPLYTDIGLDMRAKLNFTDSLGNVAPSVSDVFLTLTPYDGNNWYNGNVIYYTDGETFILANSKEGDHAETLTADISSFLHKHSNLSQTNENSSTVRDIDLAGMNVSLRKNSSDSSHTYPTLFLSDIGLRLTTGTETSATTFNYAGELGGGIFSGYNDQLTMNEFADATANRLPYAVYQKKDTADLGNGLAMSDFVSVLDIAGQNVQNTQFTLTYTDSVSGKVSETLTHGATPIRNYIGLTTIITPDLQTVSIAEAENENGNKNSFAVAVLDSFSSSAGESSIFGGTFAELSFSNRDNAMPDMNVWLMANVNGNPITLTNSKITIPEGNHTVLPDTILKKVEYTAHGTWTDKQSNEYSTEFGTTFDFLNATYSDPYATITSANDRTKFNKYIGNDGVINANTSLSIPMQYDPDSSNVAITDGFYDNPDKQLVADVSFIDTGLEVPSIAVALNAIEDGSFENDAALFALSEKDYPARDYTTSLFATFTEDDFGIWKNDLLTHYAAAAIVGKDSLTATWNRAVDISSIVDSSNSNTIYAITQTSAMTLKLDTEYVSLNAAYAIQPTAEMSAIHATLSGATLLDGIDQAAIQSALKLSLTDSASEWTLSTIEGSNNFVDFVGNANRSVKSPDVVVTMTLTAPDKTANYTGGMFHTGFNIEP